jgi:two-component system OmpR family sensor kinase
VKATGLPREQVRPGWRKAAATAPGRVLALARRVPAALLPPALGGLPFLRNGDQPGQATLAAPAPTLPAATLLGQAPPSAPRLGPGAPASSHPASRRWPFRYGWVDAAWVAFSVANLVAMMFFPQWETVPFHFIWISFTILYGFRVWAARPTLWVLGIVILATGAAISWDVWRQFQPLDELTEVPLMAAMFLAMVWHARRRLLADEERSRVSAENARLLATQRRFLQDASHQLRTPITIALGHAELLAAELGNRGRAARDIDVVVGELTRLRHLGERLLMIAAAEDPEFLRLEPVALDRFTMDVLRKWMPTAARTWRLGRLDAVTVEADRERLGLAVDALLENAVRHTRADGIIQLSVLPGDGGGTGRMIIADSGTGIPAAELAHIFDRFRSGAGLGDARRTGLGLALVRAVAQAHGGEALVRSTPGQGSEFELVLPVTAAEGGGGTVPPAAGSAPSPPGTTTLESSWRGRTS